MPGTLGRLYAELIERYIDLHAWPTSRKVALVMSFGLIWHLLIWIPWHFLIHRGGILQDAFDTGSLSLVIGGWTAWVAITAAGGLLLDRAGRDAWWFGPLMVAGYGAGMGWVIYLLGLMSTAWFTLFPLGTLFIALFFDAKTGWFTFVYGTLICIAVVVLQSLEMIPYAPALRERVIDAQWNLPWYAITMGAVYLFFLYTFLLVMFAGATRRAQSERLARAYRELAEAKDQLVRTASLAAVGSLVTGAAHELRNPLSSSGGILQSLLEEVRDEKIPLDREELAEGLGAALSGQNRAGNIVDRLYRLSDELSIKGSTLKLTDTLDSLVAEYPGLRVEASEECRELRIHEAVLRGVLPNLLDNARQAGGRQAPVLRAWKRDGVLWFEVADKGCGIAAEDREKVFQPFYSGHRGGAGARVGLGLYVAHEVVGRLGGTIELESAEGEGTTVRVSLPLVSS